MSDEKPPDKPPDDAPVDKPAAEQSSALEKREEAKLEAILEKVPPDQFPTIIREMVFGVFDRTSGPRTDPEALRIAAATVDKDNEYKFKYLTQKQELDAAKDKRDHDFAVDRNKSIMRMCWPVLMAVLILALGSIAAGIYLAATGKETLGYSILSSTVTGLFAFIGGLGFKNILKIK